MLMNSMGFYGVFLGLKFKHDSRTRTQLDLGNLAGLETITIQIPLSLPYSADDTEFERIDGKYEYNGEYFRLVKQRYANDTLTIVCIKDQNEKAIEGGLRNYVKTFAQHHTESNGAKFQVSLIKDYLPQSFAIIPVSLGWTQTTPYQFYAQNESVPHLSLEAPPPRLL